MGAVIVNDNRIISSGYNGFPSSTPHKSIMKNGHEINTIHAEINTICDAAKRGVSIAGGTMYVNYFPCIYCTKSIIASGIKKIIYYKDYKNDELVFTLLKNSNISIRQFNYLPSATVSGNTSNNVLQSDFKFVHYDSHMFDY